MFFGFFRISCLSIFLISTVVVLKSYCTDSRFPTITTSLPIKYPETIVSESNVFFCPDIRQNVMSATLTWILKENLQLIQWFREGRLRIRLASSMLWLRVYFCFLSCMRGAFGSGDARNSPICCWFRGFEPPKMQVNG